MPVLVQYPESEEDAEFIQDMAEALLEGNCYELAIAIHRGTGWPLYGLLMHDGVVRHAAVQTPEGQFFDARGRISVQQLYEPFGNTNTLSLQKISEQTMQDVRRVDEHAIDMSRRIAELAWPDLPWMDSARTRMVAFLQDLEELSRRHSVWIRSPVPAAAPHLEPADGSEDGYTLRPTLTGGGWYFDRRCDLPGSCE